MMMLGAGLSLGEEKRLDQEVSLVKMSEIKDKYEIFFSCDLIKRKGGHGNFLTLCSVSIFSDFL
jgi:hypothetical protein